MPSARIEDLTRGARRRVRSMVKLTTDDGVVGWSEYHESIGGRGLTAAIRGIAEPLGGQGPRPVERVAAIFHIPTHRGRRWAPGTTADRNADGRAGAGAGDGGRWCRRDRGGVAARRSRGDDGGSAGAAVIVGRLASGLPPSLRYPRRPARKRVREAGMPAPIIAGNNERRNDRLNQQIITHVMLNETLNIFELPKLIVLILVSLLIYCIHADPVHADEYYLNRTVWDRFGGGHLNISSFAFRDINRNGIYDMADQPMAGVMFEVTGGGKTIARRTNKSGFGNFAMSVLDRNRDIVNRGEYAFLAMIPPGWLLTTDNGRQTSFVDLMPGAPADMVSSTSLQPVGLAQELTISGRVASSAGAAETARSVPPPMASPGRVRAVSPAGRQQDVAVDSTGSFSFAATPGSWTVVAETGAGEVLGERRVAVSAAPVVLAALVPGEARPRTTRPSVVASFDDLVTAGIKEIPSGYRDLNWRNWVVTHHKFYDGEGYVNTTMSGEFVAYNSSGHPVVISRARPFDFIGGYFGSAWLQAEGETLRVKGWRGATLVYEEDIRLSALGPVYFSADFHDVTQIEFQTLRYWQFVCDDLEFFLPD